MDFAIDVATGAFGALIPKLNKLRQLRKDIDNLMEDLEATRAALRDVGEVPLKQQTEVIKNWAREARELSYDMEDIIDILLVRVEAPNPPSDGSWWKSFIKESTQPIQGLQKRYQISEQIDDIRKRAMEAAARRDRNKVADAVNQVTSVDPRINALYYAKMTELVAIDEARKEIVDKLQLQKIISIVGFGGLGKTTLARAVHNEIKSQFDCTAFVTVSQNPDMKMLFKNMLYKLDKERYREIHSKSYDIEHLTDEVREFISRKRCFIIIDDIWDIDNWNTIKSALLTDNTGCRRKKKRKNDNTAGCRIITTTRNVEVAQHIGGDYEMKPLSPDNSRILLYRRIFGSEDPKKCPNYEELVEVSDRILKKCAGVPLAIITIASLLANKPRSKTVWDEVCNSIGPGMDNSPQVETMRKILSYSYYDMSSQLRTCLLYLSMFPEDFEIEKDRLIRLWIAEGFIQHKRQEKMSLYELGESYFNELINRSMIQPSGYLGTLISQCRVHDMVLDLLRFLSSVENFVTVYSDFVTVYSAMDQTSTGTTVRRLSFQQGNVDHDRTRDTWTLEKLRSVIVFSPNSNQIPCLERSMVLRVLDLQGCDLSEGYNLSYLSSLVQLRYLSLNNTSIDLPEEVGNLRFLETLDVVGCGIFRLPLIITQLKHLMFLSVGDTRLPNMIGNLKSLVELSAFQVDEESSDNVQALGLLTELRVLSIFMVTNKWNDKLVESLGKLQNIQRLEITNGDDTVMDGLNDWVAASRRVQLLGISDFCWFPKLPAGMDLLLNLSVLNIKVRELLQEDLRILGRLPSLSVLNLEVDHVALKINERSVIFAGWFPCLLSCSLYGFVMPMLFRQGAMPRLTELYFGYDVGRAKEINFSLVNLQSLQSVSVKSRSVRLRKECEKHPNRPTLEIQ